MIYCSKVQEDLSSFLDEELAPEEQLQVEQHLQVCNICRQEYFELKATVSIMHSLELMEPPPGFHKSLELRLLEAKKRKFPPKYVYRSWFSLGAVAAGLLLVVASWGILFNDGLPKLPAHQRELLDQSISEKAIAPQDKLEQEHLSLALTDEATSEKAAKEHSSPQQELEQEKAKDLDTKVSEPENIKEETLDTKAVNGYGDMPGSRGINGQKNNPIENEDSINNRDEEQDIDRGNFAKDKSGSDSEQGEPRSMAGLSGAPADNVDSGDTTLYGMGLRQSIPNELSGPKIVLDVGVRDLGEALVEVETIVQEHALKMQSISTEDIITIEITLPTPKQKKVVEKLKGIGKVNKEELSNQELDKMIVDLTNWKDSLIQRQSELETLILNGGSEQEVQVWQAELKQISKETKDIQEKLVILEKEQVITRISLKLFKENLDN